MSSAGRPPFLPFKIRICDEFDFPSRFRCTLSFDRVGSDSEPYCSINQGLEFLYGFLPRNPHSLRWIVGDTTLLLVQPLQSPARPAEIVFVVVGAVAIFVVDCIATSKVCKLWIVEQDVHNPVHPDTNRFASATGAQTNVGVSVAIWFWRIPYTATILEPAKV